MDSPDSAPRRSRAPRTPEQARAIALAQERRQTMLLRARRIRRSVAALAAALFSLAFLVIYVQLASGHDPALLANAKRASAAKATEDRSATAAKGEASDPSSGTSTTSSDESAESTESSTDEESSSSASAVTTSQS
jgi:hypothetical protein